MAPRRPAVRVIVRRLPGYDLISDQTVALGSSFELRQIATASADKTEVYVVQLTQPNGSQPVDLGEQGYQEMRDSTGLALSWEELDRATREGWRFAAEGIQRAIVTHGPLNADHDLGGPDACHLCQIIANQ
jgi:hypothetical protein